MGRCLRPCVDLADDPRVARHGGGLPLPRSSDPDGQGLIDRDDLRSSGAHGGACDRGTGIRRRSGTQDRTSRRGVLFEPRRRCGSPHPFRLRRRGEGESEGIKDGTCVARRRTRWRARHEKAGVAPAFSFHDDSGTRTSLDYPTTRYSRRASGSEGLVCRNSIVSLLLRRPYPGTGVAGREKLQSGFSFVHEAGSN